LRNGNPDAEYALIKPYFRPGASLNTSSLRYNHPVYSAEHLLMTLSLIFCSDQLHCAAGVSRLFKPGPHCGIDSLIKFGYPARFTLSILVAESLRVESLLKISRYGQSRLRVSLDPLAITPQL
jgi:hypothetical protein